MVGVCFLNTKLIVEWSNVEVLGGNQVGPTKFISLAFPSLAAAGPQYANSGS